MNSEKYHVTARVIHWLMAVGFAFMWLCGYTMESLLEEESSLSELLLELHISVGVTLLVLLVIRIIIRVMYTPPKLPDGIPRMERIGAHLGHAALYALPAAIIAVGWAETNFGGHAVQWFGLEIPNVFPAAGEEWEELAELFHLGLAYTMLAVAVVHVAAVAKHRWIDRHDVLSRMTFGRKHSVS